MKPAAILEVQKLTKTFGSFHAVKHINFTVQKGEIFGFLGPNGAGKSTTIRMILSILKPTSGEVVLFSDPTLSARKAHGRIGYLSGDMVLEDGLTGRQYLDLVNALYGGGHDKKIAGLAKELEANLSKKMGSYSRGNRQKIGLIAALMHEPELLILDEPSSGFDPLVQEKFIRLVREYRDRGGTVFMSSHILSEVQELCDRIAFIKDGKIVSEQSLEQLEAETSKRVHVVWQNHGVVANVHLLGLKQVSQDATGTQYSYEGDISKLLTAFAKQPIKDITIREPDLEELFLTYYGEKRA